MTYEITWQCVDGDWIYTRREFDDYHAACVYALSRVAEWTDPRDKMRGAQVLCIAPAVGMKPTPGG